MSRPTLVLVVALLATSLAAPVTAVAGTAPDAGESLACGLGSPSAIADSNANGSLSITTFVAPGETYDELRNASAVAAATGAGNVTPIGPEARMANGDVVVHRIELNGSATRLLDRLAAQNRESPTANFRSLVRQEGVELRYVGPSACPPKLALNATIERGALRVVPDRRNDSLSLLVDVDAAVFDPLGDPGPTDDWERGRHAISLELRRSSGLVEENVTAEASYRVEERAVTFETPTRGLVGLSADANRPIRGRTTVAPGTRLRIQLRPVDAPTGALTATATVNRSGGFAARFDLSNVSGSALYELSVPGARRDEDFRRTTLVAVGNATGAAVSAGTPESEGLVLDDVSVSTTHGGFVVVRNASGEVVGHSRYLEPGGASPQTDLRPPVRTNQTVTVAVYRDVNGNRTFDPADEPYRANGSVVRDTANVTVEGEPPEVPTTVTTTTLSMPTRRTATQTTETPRPTSAQTAGKPLSGGTTTGPSSDETTRVPIPGFGPVATVVAAGLASLLARRR